MSSGVPNRPLTKAEQAFRDCYFRIRCPQSAERLWHRHFSPQERERLGGDLRAAYSRYRTSGMWAILRGVSRDRAVVDVARKLNFLSIEDYRWLLREIGEFSDPDEAKAAAIAAGDLVLVERPRRAYWNGDEIIIDWNRFGAPWDYLWELCRHAKAGRPIDRWSFGEDASAGVVTKRKHALTSKPQFPIDLTDLMIAAGRSTQRLNLPPQQIHVFEASATGRLTEWHPSGR